MATVQPGQVINGRYQLDHMIGSGGMSKVWLAHDRLLDRQVAVKVLAERYASDPDFVERFRREASAAAGLSHPNIVGVYDRGESDGSYYIVMEYLPGPDLKAIIRQRGRLDPQQAVDAALQVLQALSAAHRRDVIHRDIKPQNVLVAEDGLLKVTDFGIARAGEDRGMTEVGAVIGTAQYLSPEQARGEEVTPASDCYALGVMLYEMLTGRVPFDGDTPVSIALRQINEAPVPPRVSQPHLSPALNDIVMKALEKRPGARFRTAEEFTQALLAVRQTLPEPAEGATQVLAAGATGSGTRMTGPISTPPTAVTRMQPTRHGGDPPMPPRQPQRRSRRGFIAAIITLLVLAGAASALLFTDIGRSPDTVTIPSLRGQTEDDAVAQLTDLGLKPTVARDNDGDIPVDQVIRTEPAADATAEKNDTVTVYVSEGPNQETVPRVVGMELPEATAELERRGFKVESDEDFSDKPKGVVIAQDPEAGDQIDENGTITLTVSKGAEQVTVPNLLLENRQDAKSILERAGLTLGEAIERESSKRDPGTIIGQDPTAGGKLAKGSAVNITVAKKPEEPEVPTLPDVLGQNVEAASAKLKDLGFNVLTGGVADGQPVDTVIGQDPPGGTPVDAGATVSLTFSTGPDEGPPTTQPGTP